jgi:hypothetical protein
MDSRKETLAAIHAHAHELHVALIVDSRLDPARVLAAIAHNESRYGANNVPRHEPAFDAGGRYADRAALEKYGREAACSWGPWQVMYVTAKELGYKGAPKELADPEVSLPFAIKLVNERLIERQGAKSLAEIAVGYNSGSIHGDAVKGYAGNCLMAYESRETLDFLAGKFA